MLNVPYYNRIYRVFPYPRIDQIHDAVGIPPKSIPHVYYVSEDSFFADRISSYTGLPRDDVQLVLKEVHKKQGEPVLKKYLQSLGYNGEISTVFTSDIEQEIELATRIWERILGTKFRRSDRNFAKVELMYTGIWLEILKLHDPNALLDAAVIFEAASKMILKGWLKIDDWFSQQSYGESVNSNLGIAGYIPFLTTKGDGSVLSNEEVPNRANYDRFEIPEIDVPWYVTNLLFTKKSVINEGPSSISEDKAKDMIRSDLSQYYEGQ